MLEKSKPKFVQINQLSPNRTKIDANQSKAFKVSPNQGKSVQTGPNQSRSALSQLRVTVSQLKATEDDCIYAPRKEHPPEESSAPRTQSPVERNDSAPKNHLPSSQKKRLRTAVRKEPENTTSYGRIAGRLKACAAGQAG